MPKSSKRHRAWAVTAEKEQATSAPPDSAGAVLAGVLAKAITAIQAQQVPAGEAVKAAMKSLGAAQKAGLELLLEAAQAQAEVVRQLLDCGPAATRTVGAELGSLLVQAVERSPEILDSVATGFRRWLAAVAGPGPTRSNTSAGVSTSSGKPLASELRPTEERRQPAEAQTLEAILATIAEGYSDRQTGGEVAQTIRARYPAAIPDMQKYLAMDDFLVLLWLRQQPALAKIAGEEGFARFYAELKSSLL